MKAQDIVLQLAGKLTQLTDQFTANADVLTISVTGTTATATTDLDHPFGVNAAVNILNSLVPISVASFTRVGTIGTIVTDTDHDITKKAGKSAITSDGSGNANVEGSIEPEFNGAFKITNIPNRQTIIVEMVDSGPTAATGAPQLTNGSNSLQDFNGIHQVTAVPSTTTFEFEVSAGLAALPDPVGTNIKARGSARISGSVSLEKIVESYTAQPQSDLWAFVVLEDVLASKDRQIRSDATDNIQRGDHYRQQIMQQASIYVVFPSSQEIATRISRDAAEDLFRPLCQSILFKRFDSYLFAGEYNPLHFLSHGFAFSNDAFYVHQYVFEQVADILFEDTVGFDDDVAFRDITMDMFVDTGSGLLTAEIDLDEEQL